MISTQRLILMVIGINIIIGLVSAIYNNPSTYDSTLLSTENNVYEEYGEKYNSEDPFSGVTNRDLQQETSVGNSISIGKILWDVFKEGINPFSVTAGDFNTTVEQIFATMLMLFRSLMWVLLVIEAIMFFKNKKQS